MSVKLGCLFPDFEISTNQGHFESFHRWIGQEYWAILFSHPADFTPVCTTELARAAQLNPEFTKRNVKLIALSCDSVESHKAWIPDILAYQKYLKKGEQTKEFPFPIIADESRKLANLLGMIDPDEIDVNGIPLTARAVFVLDPSKRLKLSILYPATTGRNFDEILRVVDSLQLTARNKVATPVDWNASDACMVVPNLSDSEAEKLFSGKNISKIEMPSGKNYLRNVKLDQNS